MANHVCGALPGWRPVSATGDPDRRRTSLTVAFNGFTTYFAAMRLQRFRSLLTAAYAVLFTVAGSIAILCWQASAVGVIFAHALSVFVCCCVGVYWVWNSVHLLPPDSNSARLEKFLSRVLPFAAAVWVTNVLANLFPFVDRYIIVAISGEESHAAFEMLGQYHVARLIPVFMLAMAQMFQSMLLPYLSKDWEAGDRQRVRDRLNSFVRLFGLCFFMIAAGFLFVGPATLTCLFGGKYEAGLSVLHLTLVQGVFVSLFVVVSSYMWCESRGWLVNAGLLVALMVTAALNLLLVPRFGLYGAAAASGSAALILLFYAITCCRVLGMRFSVATLAVMSMPLILLAGPMASVATILVVGAVTFRTDCLLTRDDKRGAMEVLARLGDRLSTQRG